MKKYRDKYGINPDTFASWSYNATQVLALANGYNIVKNEGGRIVFMKRVDFPVQ